MPYETLKNIKPRKYQSDIYEICKSKNCLVVLPTGIGKTLIALMLAINRQKAFPGSKALFLAPTRPLAQQHLEYFKKNLPELFGQLEIFTGKVNAEKRKEIWQTADIIFSTPQCVSGETMIFTQEGPMKISDFFNKFNFEEKEYINGKCKIANIKEKILGFDGENIRFLEASKAIKKKVNNLIKIKAELGNNILCTEEHPFLTIDSLGEINWKSASQLNEGDYMASIKNLSLDENSFDIHEKLLESNSLKISDKSLVYKLLMEIKKNKIKSSVYSKYYHNFMPLDLFLRLSKELKLKYDSLYLTDNLGKSMPLKVDKKMSPSLSYIIGAMLGDGHLGNRKGHGGEVVFSDLDNESVRNEFKNKVKEVFNIEMKNEKSKGLVAYNSALASILEALGVPKGAKAKRIEVPKYLFFTELESVRGFIKGIFDTDGNASKYGVSISSVSKKFIQQLKWLLLRLGIVSNLEKNKSRGIINNRVLKESEIYSVRFSGRKNLEKFLEIKPNVNKCKKLTDTLNNTKRPETRSKEILPVLNLMKKIRKENLDKEEYYKFSCLSTINLKKLSEKIGGQNASKLKKLLDLPIRWVKIKKKEVIYENQEVYDLTVEQEHNFITNCLISHNCIANDLKKNLYSLEDVSLLIEDECHRCLKNYSYTYVAQRYQDQAKNQRILGLTASPGAEKKIVEQIAKNLNVESIELRTRDSPDVKEYLQDLNFEAIRVDFPEDFDKIRILLRKILNKKLNELKNRKLLFGPPTKKFLLEAQARIMKAITSGNRHFNLLMGASACSQALKLEHALELLETQTLHSVYEYFHDLFNQAKENKSKAVINLVKQPEFNQAFVLINELLAKKIEHPKLKKLSEIINYGLENNAKAKVIVFTQFRLTAATIAKELNSISNVKAKVFVGQAIKKNRAGEETGLNQKEQNQIINEFKEGAINVLVATSIGEEGLDIPEVNAVIFYEPIPSAIRKIQRAGRTARLMEGNLIILITRDTRDEAFHYAAINREKKMYSAIKSVKETLDLNNSIEKEIETTKEEKEIKEGNILPEKKQKTLFDIYSG